MPMKQIAFRIPEELESKIPKPSLNGDRTKFLRDLIESKIQMDKSLTIYEAGTSRRQRESLRDADLIAICEAEPYLEIILQELQYLRMINS